MKQDKIAGRCFCGQVEYRVDGPIRKVVNCHCNLCRKMNGTAFSTYAVVLEKEFSKISGDLNSFAVNDNVRKHQCKKCGSAMFNTNPVYQGLVMLYLGSLDNASSIEPDANIYSESQLHWLPEIKQLLSFEQALIK